MIAYTNKYDIQRYLENAQIGDTHLAIYPTCWFVRRLTRLNNNIIQGTNIASNISGVTYFSFDRTRCLAICIVPLTTAEINIFTMYPELLI